MVKNTIKKHVSFDKNSGKAIIYFQEVSRIMDIIISISVALVAVAFVVLVYFLSGALKSLQITLNHVAVTLESLEKQLDGVTRETTDLLHKTNQLAEDVQKKSDSLNNVFSAVQDFGQSVQKVNQSVRKVTDQITVETERQSKQISQAVQWGNAALNLWEKYKLKKSNVDTATNQYSRGGV